MQPIFAPGFSAGINRSLDIDRAREQEQQRLAESRQRMARDAWQMQVEQQDRQRQAQARASAGQAMYGMQPPPPVAGGQPPAGPQPPAPGQASQPMAPPGGPPQGQPPQGGPAPAGGPPPMQPPMQPPQGQPDPRVLEIQRCKTNIASIQRELAQPNPRGPATPNADARTATLRAELAKNQDQLAKLTGTPPPYRTVPQAGGGSEPPPQAPGTGAPPPVGGQPPPQGMLAQIIRNAKAQGIPPEQLTDMVDAMGPALKMQVSEEMTQLRSSVAAQSAEFRAIALGLTAGRDAERGRHNQASEDAAVQRIQDAKARAQAGAAPTSSELQNPETARVFYDIYKATGRTPPFAWGKAGEADRTAWMQAVKRFSEDDGGGAGVAAAQADNKGKASALAANEKRNAGLDVGARETLADIATMDSTIDAVAAKGGARILNSPINKIRSLGSDPAYGQLELVTKQVATKYERMLAGGILSVAQLHEGAREDAKKILSGDMTVAEIRAKIPLMKREMENAIKSGKATSKGIRDDIAGKGGDDEDKQAIAWAKANPGDARAKKILALHGM